MNKNPLVSCIIIFLNGEKFIKEAIESVLSQTYENWELLLVDDGSTDNSTDIALDYSQKNPNRVRYLEHTNHQNQGMSSSRNMGVLNAKGDYIAFLDCDDIWLQHKLERQVAIMNSYPEAGMVYGSTLYWSSWTGKPEDRERDYMPELCVPPDTLVHSPNLLKISYPLGIGTAPCPSDIMVRREVMQSTGGFEESFTGKYQLYEDQAFLVRVYLKESVFISSECWDRYRLHPDSCVTVVNKAGEYDSVRSYFLSWFEKYLRQQQVKDQEIWYAFQNAIKPYL
jgi:glycosyltransferase involved in cell wall biosynthesis